MCFVVAITSRRQAVRKELRPRLGRSVSTEAFSAQNGSSGRRFEGHGVILATLIARDFKPLALAARTSCSSEI
jgi:hypothetical protein